MPPSPKAVYAEAINNHQALMSQPQVEPEAFLASIATIETTGQAAIGAKGRGKVTRQTVGEAVIAAIGNAETQSVIEPPLSADHQRLLAGKVVVWATAAGASEDQPTPVGQGQASKSKK